MSHASSTRRLLSITNHLQSPKSSGNITPSSTGGLTHLHLNTPLLESAPLSSIFPGVSVLIKLDTVQPTGSFKIRGIGYHCIKAVERGCSHLVTSSGGNAGHAVAYSGRLLKVPVTVVVPKTTSKFMADKIRSQGAEVIVHGAAWDEANELATQLAKKPGHILIHPFDHPEIWEGHTSIILEAAASYKEMKRAKPRAVLTVVGGGGLLSGILRGLDKVGWSDVPVLACETLGAHSFHEALKHQKLVTLPGIASIATTLGARRVSNDVLEASLERNKRKNGGDVYSVVVDDKEAVQSCFSFASDERALIEPSCGAGLAALYFKKHPLPELIKSHNNKNNNEDINILVIVCGGSAVSLEALENWKRITKA